MKKVSYDIFLVALGAFFGVVGPAIVSQVMKIPFWSGFKYLFTFPIPLWIVLLIVFAIYLIRKITVTSKFEEIPDYHNYTQEKINGVTWKWRYIRTDSGRWGIDDLRPICSECESVTKYEFDSYSPTNSFKASCLQCSNVMAPLRSLTDIEAILIDNIDRNIYPNPT